MPASGSSSCASKPAETSTSSGSNALDRRRDRRRRTRAGTPSSPEPADSGTLSVVSSLLLRAAGARDRTATGAARRRSTVSSSQKIVLRPVAVVDVEVDDRDALERRVRLRDARGDRDVVEEAEAHRAVRRARGGRAAARARSRRVAPPRSPCPRRAAPPRTLVSDAGVSRVEPGRRVDRRGCARRSAARVAAEDLAPRSPPALAPVGNALEQRREPLRPLGWCPSDGAPRAAGALTTSTAPSPPSRSASWFSPHVARERGAAVPVGLASASAGAAPSASIVAMRR